MVITSGSKKVNEVFFFFLIAWGKLRAYDVELYLFFAHSLDAIDPNAYEAFQASNNLTDVVQRCLQKKESNAGVLPGMSKKLSIKASLMTPVKPMLVWSFLLCYLHCLCQMNAVLNCFLCFVLVSTVSTHSECTYYIWVEVTPSLSAQVFPCPCLSTMFWAMQSAKRFVRGLALPQANLSWTRVKSSLQGRNVHLTTRKYS